MMYAKSPRPCASLKLSTVVSTLTKKIVSIYFPLIVLRAHRSLFIIQCVEQHCKRKIQRSKEVWAFDVTRVTCLIRVKSPHFNTYLLIVDTLKICLHHLLKFPTHPGYSLPIVWHPASDIYRRLLFNPSMSSMEISKQFLPYCIITNSFQGTQTWCLSFRVRIQRAATSIHRCQLSESSSK